MENYQEKNILENLALSFRRSVTVKVASIFILMLLLLIPMAFIRSLITEREIQRQSVITEVSEKWANDQHVYGPVLTLPLKKTFDVDGNEKGLRFEAHILPTSLSVDGKINPESLYRSIYEVVVYDSKITFTGSFYDLSSYSENLAEYEVLWDEAFLTVNISDLRGIKEKVVVEWDGKEKSVEPGSAIPGLIKSGVTISNIFDGAPSEKPYTFSFDLKLQGSQYLGFIPLGKETNISLSSDWPDPSFAGAFLPDRRSVTDKGFEAEYKILELNRNYPQFWVGNRHIENIGKSAFGVDLLLPMNDYQKSTRSAKYALLAISLTFLTFFLVEIFNRKEVHPFQYILIGLALCLFYTLLVSISEHSNFDLAYSISSITIISIIGLYAKSIFKNLLQTLVLVSILCLTYTFVYITLQLQDYALLIGSLGLTTILALTMYITRNIDWYKLHPIKKTPVTT